MHLSFYHLHVWFRARPVGCALIHRLGTNGLRGEHEAADAKVLKAA